MIDLSKFWRNDRVGEFDVQIEARGTIRETIKAQSVEQARAIAEEMIEDGNLELYAQDFDECRVTSIRPNPPMYLVRRDGKDWGVSHPQPGDEPRAPSSSYEEALYTVAPSPSEVSA